MLPIFSFNLVASSFWILSLSSNLRQPWAILCGKLVCSPFSSVSPFTSVQFKPMAGGETVWFCISKPELWQLVSRLDLSKGTWHVSTGGRHLSTVLFPSFNFFFQILSWSLCYLIEDACWFHSLGVKWFSKVGISFSPSLVLIHIHAHGLFLVLMHIHAHGLFPVKSSYSRPASEDSCLPLQCSSPQKLNHAAARL